jgi:D-alanyl-D-alanine carboxypeptidase/D-alanyl-D-alanine-endopeptidase (penicillin-binding protein 4)
MKTGTIDDVRAIAGYLSSRSGHTYAVAMLHNHPGIHQGSGTQVQDALLRWLFER